jgi:hypothetical protein
MFTHSFVPVYLCVFSLPSVKLQWIVVKIIEELDYFGELLLFLQTFVHGYLKFSHRFCIFDNN